MLDRTTILSKSWATEKEDVGVLDRLADAGPKSAATPATLTLTNYGDETSASRVRILIVEGDGATRAEFVAALTREGYETVGAGSKEAGLALLQSGRFDLALCGLMAPEQDGFAFLHAALVASPDTPVVIVAEEGGGERARRAIHEGASDFLLRPFRPGELPTVVARNLTRQAMQRKDALRCQLALQTSEETLLDALLSALNLRDTETEGHSERVTAYTMELADRFGLPESELYPIERGALLHDIGKIGISDQILLKPGPLTPEEWVEMRKHPVIGYEMCARIAMLQDAAQIVRHHHEAWDGQGYPDGLAGEAIPLGARLFAIADTLDAMTSDRPYRAALSFAAAREEIEKNRRRQFDPDAVAAFLEVPEARWQAIRVLAEKLRHVRQGG